MIIYEKRLGWVLTEHSVVTHRGRGNLGKRDKAVSEKGQALLRKALSRTKAVVFYP